LGYFKSNLLDRRAPLKAGQARRKIMLNLFLATLLLIIAGGLFFYHLSTPATIMNAVRSIRRWLNIITRYGTELGGYVHDTAMSQYIPPTEMMGITGTFTQAAGTVAGTIAFHRAAAAQTSVIYIPIILPSNSAVNKGAYLKSIEVDYENLLAAATSVTFALNKVTRGVSGTVAVVSAVTVTQSLTAASGAAIQDQLRCLVTLTTPQWIDNDVYYILTMSIVAGATVTNDVLAAVANYTLRV
jgi:hypothetical protein